MRVAPGSSRRLPMGTASEDDAALSPFASLDDAVAAQPAAAASAKAHVSVAAVARRLFVERLIVCSEPRAVAGECARGLHRALFGFETAYAGGLGDLTSRR